MRVSQPLSVLGLPEPTLKCYHDGMMTEVLPYAAVAGPSLAAGAYGTMSRYGVGMPYWRADDPNLRANVRRAASIRRGWVRAMRNLDLCVEDRVPNLAQRMNGEVKAVKPQIKVPRIDTVDADIYGVTLVVETVDGIGAKEIRGHAKHLSDIWKMRDLQVSDLVDTRPGFVELRALFTDPLTITIPMQVPDRLEKLDQIPLGLNGLGVMEYLPIAQTAGVNVTGASGFGKSKFLNYLVVTLAPSPEVVVVVANGKVESGTTGDFRAAAPRISHLVGSDPWEVNDLLRGLQKEMYRRLGCIYEMWRVDEFWQHGPTVDMPWIVVIMDECQTYLTTTEKKTPRAKIIASNAEIAEDLQKKMRAAGITILWATQKGTGDAIPTAIRDISTASITFPVRSRAQEQAALGEEISDYPDMSPRKILKDKYRGVGTILKEGDEGYTRFKVPIASPKLTEAVCAATAKYARNVPGISVGTTHRADTPADLLGKRAPRKNRKKPPRQD